MVGGGELRIFLWAQDTTRSLKHGCGGENVFNGKSSQGWEELARLLPIKDLLKLIQSLVLLSPSFASPNS